MKRLAYALALIPSLAFAQAAPPTVSLTKDELTAVIGADLASARAHDAYQKINAAFAPPPTPALTTTPPTDTISPTPPGK